MFFSRERIVLRNGIVVEVEPLPAEPPARKAPVVAPAAPVAAAVPASTTAVTDPAVAAALQAQAQAQARAAASGLPIAGGAVPPGVAAPVPGVAPGVVGTPAAPIQPVGVPAALPEVPVAVPAPPPPAPEPQLAIKFVRPPSAGGARPVVAESTRQPAVPQRDESAATAQPPTVVAEAADSVAKPVPASPAAAQKSGAPEPKAPGAVRAATKTAGPAASNVVSTDVREPETPVAEEAAPSEPKKAKTPRAKSRAWRRRLHEDDFPEPVESIFTARTYAIAFVVIAAGGGYLLWRRRQRQLELAASAVSHTPFSGATTGGSGALFDAALLAKLEWKRFEELVASYYVKTGVVAVRTKSGPASPVHVKISWKGEPRPFACVQCIAHPSGLIESKPIQDLYEVLAADDIRRGYVVSTGKFSIPARDFAEEKHLTLLSGDLLLEKLNALPDSARSELMEEITAGDYTTPSCPVCEAKAVRKSDESPGWICRSHPDAAIPAPP